MDLRELSDEAVRSNLLKLTGDEREVTLKVLYYLIEVERRGLFREEGYSSLFDYCRRKLLYSEAGAGRRVAASRCLRDNPELGSLFLDGKVSLCTMTTAYRSIKDKLTTVNEIVGKSRDEVKTLVALSSPVPSKPKEVVKPIAVKAPLIPKEERYELKFSVSKKVYESFTQAKGLLSNSLGRDLSLEATFGRLLDNYLNRKTKARPNAESSTRYIPRSIKREVLKRDSHQCSFVSRDGTRCTETNYLQFDHIRPYALGGKSESSNLRLLCSCHNQLMAENTFGRDYIKQKMQ